MMTSSQHAYEVRPRKDRRGVDLISDALPFGRLWTERCQQCESAMPSSTADHMVPSFAFSTKRKVIDTHEHKGEFEEP